MIELIVVEGHIDKKPLAGGHDEQVSKIREYTHAENMCSQHLVNERHSCREFDDDEGMENKEERRTGLRLSLLRHG